MKHALWILLVALALVAGLLLWRSGEDGKPPGAGDPQAPPAATVDSAPPLPAAEEPERTAAVEPEAPFDEREATRAEGVVVDAQGVPVADAEVLLERWDERVASVRSSEDGRFAILAPEAAPWDESFLVARKDGYAPRRMALLGRRGNVLELIESVPLMIRVRAKDGGLPVAGAAVSVLTSSIEHYVLLGVTDESGVLAIAGPRSALRMYVEADGFETSFVTGWVATADGKELEVELDRLVATITVEAAEGGNVADVTFQEHVGHELRPRSAAVEPGDRHRYRLNVCGDSLIQVRAPGFARIDALLDWTLLDGRPALAQYVVLPRECTLTGEVVLPAETVGPARVSAAPPYAYATRGAPVETTTHGAFLLRELAPRRGHWVRVSAPGASNWFGLVVTGEPGSSVALPPIQLVSQSAQVSYAGSVTDEEGRPLDDVEVRVRCGEHHYGTAFTVDGRFSLALPSPPTDAAYSKPGFVTLERSIEGAARELPVVSLRSCKTVQGIVVDEFGAPVPRAVVVMSTEGRDPRRWSTVGQSRVLSGEDGRFTIGSSACAAGRLTAGKAGHHQHDVADRVEPGAEVRLVLPRLAVVHFEIADDCRPFVERGWSVYIPHREGHWGIQRHFEMTPGSMRGTIPWTAGTYPVVVRAGGAPTSLGSVRFLGGDETIVNVRLRAPREVVLRFDPRDVRAARYGQAEFRLQNDPDTRLATAAVDADGHCALRLTDGAYVVTLGHWSWDFVVAGDVTLELPAKAAGGAGG